MRIANLVGRVIGATVAPLTFIGSLIRGSRLFHPDGVIYRAEVGPLADGGPLGPLAQRLSGTALVRLSGALREWPQSARGWDLLGAAVRFRSDDAVTPEPRPGDQDLLFATASTVPGIFIAPLRTDVSDFLGNQYHAILPFSLQSVGKVYLRLVPTKKAPAGADRRERLERAVAQGTAVLRLEVRVADGGGRWDPIASIALRERLEIEDREITFDPGTSAMGLVPSGVLQWVRPLAYAASQLGRRLRSREERGAEAGAAEASAAAEGRHGSTPERGLEHG